MIKIKPAELIEEHGPLAVEEELAPSMLDLKEHHAEADQPVMVRITVQREGSELLAMGHIETTVKLRCGRCADWIPWIIRLNDFATALEIEDENIPLDLTPAIREDILLQLPIVAACKLDEANRCPFTKKHHPPATSPTESILGEGVWQALDNLKIKEKD